MSAVPVPHPPPAFAPAALRPASRYLIACEGSSTSALIKTNIGRRLWCSPPTRGKKERPLGPGLASNCFLEFFGRAEGDLLAGLDLDRFAGCGIASHTRRALAHHQDAEAAYPAPVGVFEMRGHQVQQFAEQRLGMFFRHFMGFREICGEMLQGHGRLCARFLRCHGWPSWLRTVASKPRVTLGIRRFGYGLTMTYCRKMWVFSMPVLGKRPMTGSNGRVEGANPLICPWERAFRALPCLAGGRYLPPQHARGGVAQLVRASACHAEGRGFEPRRSRHCSRADALIVFAILFASSE